MWGRQTETNRQTDMEGETERKGSPGHVPGLRPEMEPLAGMEAAAAGGSPGQE